MDLSLQGLKNIGWDFGDYSVLWNREWTWKNTGEVWHLIIKLKSEEMAEGELGKVSQCWGIFREMRAGNTNSSRCRSKAAKGNAQAPTDSVASCWTRLFPPPSTRSLEFVQVSHPFSWNRSLMHLEQQEPGPVPAWIWWNILGNYQAVLNQAFLKSSFMCQSMPASLYMQTTCRRVQGGFIFRITAGAVLPQPGRDNNPKGWELAFAVSGNVICHLSSTPPM